MDTIGFLLVFYFKNRNWLIMIGMKNKRIGGTSFDAILLTFIKLITTALGMATTRLLSEHLSVYDYGTYSQILLIVSTVASLTIFGMMDGMNYFYCKEVDSEKKESYAATILTSQLMLGTFAGIVVMLLSAPLCAYFANPGLRGLLIFAAVLPTLQNLMWILQVLIVSVGSARKLAIRNFVVSVARLAAVVCVVTFVNSVAFYLAFTVVLDIAQIVFFGTILHKNKCHIRPSKVNFKLVGEIFKYCAPMAIFVIVNSLNRDLDKYLVSLLTDTETLAMYANASKQLPFDIIMSSFATVLVPHVIRMFSNKETAKATGLCRSFFEITYISTGILCFAALASAPQFMKLLYSNKYTAGIAIFCVYILVDFLRFTNLTIILSSAGKSKWLMMLGGGALILNAVLNVALYELMGLIGPAIATLAVTALSGVIILCLDAKVLKARISELFDFKYLLLFLGETVILTSALGYLGRVLDAWDVHYFINLVIIAGAYVMIMALLNFKRLFAAMKKVNSMSKETAAVSDNP